MLKPTRTKLLVTLLVALALSSLAFAAGAGAQRQANQNAGPGQSKRVIVGRGSETSKGSRVTITADDSLKDYRSYRSGDRLYVVLPKSAAAAGMRGSGKGYSDMQVEQRGDSVVLSYRVQPGAKSRVEQRFNRLEVVFDVPEGGGQQATATGDANAARAQQPAQPQPQPAETRNQTPAGQQSNQTAAAPAQNAGGAAERNTANAAETARAQAATPAATTPPVTTAGPQPASADPNAQPGAASAPTQEATPATTPAEAPQLAQALPPAAPVQITNPATANQASQTGSTLGTFLLRNWALTLILALVVVGLGLVVVARRNSSATPAPVEALDEAGEAKKLDESGAARAREASAAALKQASAAAAEASIVAKASPAATKPEAAKVIADITPEVVPEVVPEVTPEVTGAEAKPLVAASASEAVAVVGKSRKQSRKEARQGAKRKKKGGRADRREVEEASAASPVVQEPIAEEPVVAEAIAAETFVEESVVEESPVQESVVEETFVEESAAEEMFVDEGVAEETLVVAPVVEEAQAEEAFVSQPEIEEPAVEETTVVVEDKALPEQVAEAPAVEESLVEESPVEEIAEVVAAPAFEAAESSIEPAVESSEVAAIEPSFVESSFDASDTLEAGAVESETAPVLTEAVETEPAEAEAPATSMEIEPAVAPDHESVQAATRLLLEGGEYDRAVVGTRDPVARQMIAAELLSALAGRNAQRRERAGAAFVEQGYFDETARDLRAADAPAERAAAARSLALLGDRAATPLLIAALEDPTLDVRRAAVEALGALRDPAAVAPLEALLERERSERHRIPPRVIRVAADSCRDAAAELAVELSSAAPVETPELSPAAEPEVERADTTVEIEPVAESALEAETTQAHEVAEPQAFVDEPQAFDAVATEPEEETAVSIAPFVEDTPAVVEETAVAEEEIPAAEAETLAAEAEAFVSTEEPSVVSSEAPAEVAEALPFVPEVSEGLDDATAESQSFESLVAEPEAVVETGVSPFVELEEPTEAVSAEAAPTPAAEVALEPFAEPFAEEPGPPALFDESAAEETTREIAPVAAGEWYDLDVSELREEPRPAEAATETEQEHVFESSSGETFFESSSGETFAPHDAAETTTAETEPFIHADAEVSRELDVAGAEEPAREEVAPVFAPASSAEKGLALFDEHSTVPASIQQRLASGEPAERAAAVVELSHVDTDEAFQQICAGFDDESQDVRAAAARALYELRSDRAESFTRALREASPERRREIGMAISSSGLAGESISQLTGESRERTYEAFSLLFLMAKAGEVQPLVRAIESHPSNEVRLAVVKLLALSGQKEILPAFRRLAVRGSLPTEVRSAVMEAIYQISSSQPTPA